MKGINGHDLLGYSLLLELMDKTYRGDVHLDSTGPEETFVNPKMRPIRRGKYVWGDHKMKSGPAYKIMALFSKNSTGPMEMVRKVWSHGP